MGPAWTRSFRSGGVKPPAMPDNSENHAQSRLAWNQSAEFWSRRMGEGNDFVDVLIWPCVERLIGPIDGRRVLDIARGNGLYARRLSQAGADVVAVDFAADMVRAAIDATSDGRSIEYRANTTVNWPLLCLRLMPATGTSAAVTVGAVLSTTCTVRVVVLVLPTSSVAV